MTLPRVILASQSPRRRELLASAGVEFDICVSAAEEHLLEGESPCETVMRLAFEKASFVAKSHPGRIVLGADTLVSLGTRLLGKPHDVHEARQMLEMLSGREHTVQTGVCLMRHGGRSERWCSITSVTFRSLDSHIIDEYLSLVSTLDKAGSYAIQEHGEMIVERVNGLLSNVIGLPVEEVVEHLKGWAGE